MALKCIANCISTISPPCLWIMSSAVDMLQLTSIWVYTRYTRYTRLYLQIYGGASKKNLGRIQGLQFAPGDGNLRKGPSSVTRPKIFEKTFNLVQNDFLYFQKISRGRRSHLVGFLKPGCFDPDSRQKLVSLDLWGCQY